MTENHATSLNATELRLFIVHKDMTSFFRGRITVAVHESCRENITINNKRAPADGTLALNR